MDSNDWDKRYESSASVWSLTPNQFVVEYLEQLPAASMIDLAGGEGRNALWFAQRGWHVECADFSAVALEKFIARAQAEGIESLCTATRVDATAHTPFALAPVDLGLIAYLQIEASDLSTAISSLARAIKPGGTFFGIWHARENLHDGFAGPQDPYVLPTRKELRTAMMKAGMPDATVELRQRQVADGEETREAIDVVVLGTKP